MIRDAIPADFDSIVDVINDAAIAYKGVIPADRWQEPYMPREELQAQLAEGVRFRVFVQGGEVIGVMGIQDRGEVQLIRHAYVRTKARGQGIGTVLLQHLLHDATKPILIGTWKAATWAIGFYEKHGFARVDEAEKTRLLQRYWLIPARQVETSVVLTQALPDNRERRTAESAR
jgi:N-acetylglutamate synthase-like GNAT family acetyltransferase